MLVSISNGFVVNRIDRATIKPSARPFFSHATRIEFWKTSQKGVSKIIIIE